MYDVKYSIDFNEEVKKEKAIILANICCEAIKGLLVYPYLDVIVPVPSSKQRSFQHVYFISEKISELINKKVDFGYLKKIKETSQLKSIEAEYERKEILKDAFDCDLRYKDKKILLFDDLYRSGATLNEITRVLYSKGQVNNVYVLTLTKTAVKRWKKYLYVVLLV